MHRLVGIALIPLLVGNAFGQQKGTELGLGIGALGITISGGESVFQFEANQSIVRVGFYTSPTMAITPSAAINVASGGGATLASIQLGLAVPIYTQPTWGHSGLFFAPGAAVTFVSASAGGFSSSASQFSLGLGVGTKVSVADPASLFVAGVFSYALENDDFADAIGLGVELGISVFFRSRARP